MVVAAEMVEVVASGIDGGNGDVDGTCGGE